MHVSLISAPEAEARRRVVARLVGILAHTDAGRDSRLRKAGLSFRRLIASQAGCRRCYTPSEITWEQVCDELDAIHFPGERPCRFDHDHTRRDGRSCSRFECAAEHSAQVGDLSRLREQVGR